ncbi:MAG: type I methionyl aminopeptidase [Clostridiales bacterium GWC2_40_7]|nr:MAG: type I methionyl aminopeptidase [Clostridiales bacterium GWC2_40_7]
MLSIKSKNEIELMKKSCEIVATALELIREAVKPGITTQELDRIAAEHIKRQNATPTFLGVKCGVPGGKDFPATICASVNNEVIHGIPGLRVLKDGDIISVDIGACLNGFHGDAARTFPVGRISEKALKLIKVTEQSFFEGVKYAVPGNRIIDISKAIQDYVEGFGYSVVRDFVGHGIGRDLWEPPQIPNYRTRERGPRLEAGMTLAIEPMVNEGRHPIAMLDNKWTVVTADGSLSAHYENTIAITDTQPIIMTKLN